MKLLKPTIITACLYLASSLGFSQDIPNDIARRIVQKSSPIYFIVKDMDIDSTRIHADFIYREHEADSMDSIFGYELATLDYHLENSHTHSVGRASINAKSHEARMTEAVHQANGTYAGNFSESSNPVFMDELLRQISRDTVDDAALRNRVDAAKESIETKSVIPQNTSVFSYIKRHNSYVEYSLNPKDVNQANDQANLNLGYIMLNNGNRSIKISIDYLTQANSLHLTYKRDLKTGNIVDIKAVAVIGDVDGRDNGKWYAEIKDMNFIERILSYGFTNIADDLDAAIDKDLASNSGCESLKMRLRESYMKVVPVLKLMRKGATSIDSLLKALK